MRTTFQTFACSLIIGAMMLPAAALADNPRDPAMQSARARAQDRADTRRLNQGQLAHVSQRDARTMQAYRQAQKDGATAYEAARADYERDMAAWRRAVAACRAGQWDYCDK